MAPITTATLFDKSPKAAIIVERQTIKWNDGDGEDRFVIFDILPGAAPAASGDG